MPSFILKIKADLENISQLIPNELNLWKFDVSYNGDERHGITVSLADIIPLDGSKGEANFVMKWPGSTSQSYIKIIPVKKVTGVYDKAGEWQAILGLECRNIEITKWIPSTDFTAISIGGTIFSEGVDLSDDWADYDEENDLAVGVSGLTHMFERA